MRDSYFLKGTYDIPQFVQEYRDLWNLSFLLDYLMLAWLWLCLPILLVAAFILGLYLSKRRIVMPKAITAPFVLINAAGHVTQTNLAARQTLGLTANAAETPLVDFLPDAVAPMFLYSINAKAPGIFLDDRREARAFVLVPYESGFALTICDVDDDNRDLFEAPETPDEAPTRPRL